MRKFGFFISVLLTLVCAPVFAEMAYARNLSPEQALTMTQEMKNLYLLDVRTVEEYRQFRLNGARLIPIDQLVQRLGEIPRDRPVLVYCAVGSRSSQVVNYLIRRGYPEVYNLYGGIYAWAQKRLPVLQGGP